MTQTQFFSIRMYSDRNIRDNYSLNKDHEQFQIFEGFIFAEYITTVYEN